MRVTISAPGKFPPAYAWGRYLEGRDELERLITLTPHWRAARLGVSGQRTLSVLAVGAWAFATRGVGSSSAQARNQLAVSVAFDIAASRRLGACDVFNGWVGTALRSARASRRRGVPTVLQTGSAHVVRQTELLAEEFRRFGPDGGLTHPRLVARAVTEYEEAEAIVVPSRFSLSTFLDQGVQARKLFHVPWPVLPVARPVPRDGRSHPLRVLFVGACSLRKGIPYLLEAFARLATPATLHLVGPRNTRLIERLGLPPGSRALGPKTGEELVSEFEAADVFILPSVEDGSALVTTEAMAAGLPVVVSDQAGADAVVNGENGFVVPARDVDGLARCLDELLSDEDMRLRMGAAAAATVTARTWETYGNELLRTVYLPLLDSSIRVELPYAASA